MSEFEAIRTKELRPVTIRGQQFQVAKEPADFWGWVDNDKWEPYLFTFLEKALTLETTLIDVGAWIGPATLYASHLCKRVYAIEPDPIAYDILTYNLAANDLRNVEASQIAIMSHEGKVSLGASMLGCSVSRTSCIDNSFSAPCTSLSAFVETHRISGPLVIKIDVEGAEDRVFLDPFFLEHKPTVLVSLHPSWWQEAGKNVEGTREAIMRVGQQYRYQYDAARGFCPLTYPHANELVFTDTAL